jgi:hypothetical protein
VDRHRPFVPEHVRLTTYTWAIFASLLVAVPCAAAPASPSHSLNSATNASDLFAQHRAAGDSARLARDWSKALECYDKALAIRYDAVVMGRAGLVLRRLGRFDLATRLLQRASNDTSAEIEPKERQVFFDEFLLSADEVCRVDVHVDQTGARIEIDGTENVDGRADFYVYLNPGVHTISAQKEGFHDAVQTLVTDRQCRRNVALIMQVIPIEQISVDSFKKVVSQNLSSGGDVRESSDAKPTLYVAKPPPNPYEPSAKRWFVGGLGLWIPFGMTPGLSVGGQLHAGWRPRSFFEIAAEMKAATNISGERVTSGSALGWSVGIAPCGRVRERFFFCGLAQMNGGRSLSDRRLGWSLPSLGGRLGVEFHLTNRFHLRLFGDFLGMFGVPSFGSGRYELWAGRWWVPSVGTTFTFF